MRIATNRPNPTPITDRNFLSLAAHWLQIEAIERANFLACVIFSGKIAFTPSQTIVAFGHDTPPGQP
jgi:hypothetical protein